MAMTDSTVPSVDREPTNVSLEVLENDGGRQRVVAFSRLFAISTIFSLCSFAHSLAFRRAVRPRLKDWKFVLSNMYE